MTAHTPSEKNKQGDESVIYKVGQLNPKVEKRVRHAFSTNFRRSL